MYHVSNHCQWKRVVMLYLDLGYAYALVVGPSCG